MELRQIKDLMAAMDRTGTKRLRIKQDNFEIELEREDHLNKKHYAQEELQEHPQGQIYEVQTGNSKVDIPASLHPPVEHVEGGGVDQDGKLVTSPMVGTFYASPGPDEPSFVNVGDKVEEDTIVCIVEAMKVMNEVKAGVEGTIQEMFVETGHPVEFGSKLFKIS